MLRARDASNAAIVACNAATAVRAELASGGFAGSADDASLPVQLAAAALHEVSPEAAASLLPAPGDEPWARLPGPPAGRGGGGRVGSGPGTGVVLRAVSAEALALAERLLSDPRDGESGEWWSLRLERAVSSADVSYRCASAVASGEPRSVDARAALLRAAAGACAAGAALAARDAESLRRAGGAGPALPAVPGALLRALSSVLGSCSAAASRVAAAGDAMRGLATAAADAEAADAARGAAGGGVWAGVARRIVAPGGPADVVLAAAASVADVGAVPWAEPPWSSLAGSATGSVLRAGAAGLCLVLLDGVGRVARGAAGAAGAGADGARASSAALAVAAETIAAARTAWTRDMWPHKEHSALLRALPAGGAALSPEEAVAAVSLAAERAEACLRSLQRRLM